MFNNTQIYKNVAEYGFKTELHAHTRPASLCSKITAQEIVKKYKELKYDTIVITNHFFYYVKENVTGNDYVKMYLDDFYAAKEKGDELGISVILGAEIRFSECNNEYLVYGIKEDDLYKAFEYLDQGIQKFRQEFKNDDILIIQAHPFRDGMTREYLKYVDGLEVFNMHPAHNSRIALAAKSAREMGGYITGGSDCHDFGWEGLASMRTKNKICTSIDLVNVIRTKQYLLDICGSVLYPYGS